MKYIISLNGITVGGVEVTKKTAEMLRDKGYTVLPRSLMGDYMAYVREVCEVLMDANKEGTHDAEQAEAD